MWKEIQRLKEIVDQKVHESQHQGEKQGALEHEKARVLHRIDDL